MARAVGSIYFSSVVCVCVVHGFQLYNVSNSAVAVFHLYCVNHCCGCGAYVLSQPLLWLCSICTVSTTAVLHLYCLNHCCRDIKAVLSN